MLLRRAQAGERGALDALLRRHYDRIFGVCRRLTGNDADGADAAQDALLSIVRALGSFDGEAKFSTWTYRVAVNASFDELRRRRRRQFPTEEEVVAPDSTEPVATRLDVDAALSKLPEEFRAPVVLRDICGLDYSEIAEVLAIPGGTVRSRIARGRAALVPLLSERLRPATRP